MALARSPQLLDAKSLRYISLKKRLNAWWEGYYLPESSDVPADAATARNRAAFGELFYPDDIGPREWTEARKKVAQDLWTRGFIVPGGTEYAEELVIGCALDPAETMLEIGVGFGGTTRAVIERFGCYVTCYESDLALVEEAGRQAQIDGNTNLEVIHAKLETVKLRKNFYRAALLREVLHTVRNQSILLEKIAASLKEGQSQVVIADFLSEHDAKSPDLSQWISTETRPVHPFSIAALKKVFKRLGLVPRIVEDESGRYRNMVIQAWKEYVTTIDTDELPTEVGRQIVHESRYWSARLAALASKAIRYGRIVAVKQS